MYLRAFFFPCFTRFLPLHGRASRQWGGGHTALGDTRCVPWTLPDGDDMFLSPRIELSRNRNCRDKDRRWGSYLQNWPRTVEKHDGNTTGGCLGRNSGRHPPGPVTHRDGSRDGSHSARRATTGRIARALDFPEIFFEGPDLDELPADGISWRARPVRGLGAGGWTGRRCGGTDTPDGRPRRERQGACGRLSQHPRRCSRMAGVKASHAPSDAVPRAAPPHPEPQEQRPPRGTSLRNAKSRPVETTGRDFTDRSRANSGTIMLWGVHKCA